MNFFEGLFPGFYSKARSVFGYSTYDASVNFNDSFRTKQKLNAVLQSPALLKVISLQCDLFSLGEIYVADKEGNDLPDDQFLKLMTNPNPFQSKQQFLWDFMFWMMLGTDYCYSPSKVLDEDSLMWMLDPAKIIWPLDMDRKKDYIYHSRKEVEPLMKTRIDYRYDDGNGFNFTLDRMIVTADLTNGVGNFFKGPSRIDALYKIISNADKALDAKNVNVNFLKKFLIGSSGDLKSTGLSEEEKTDIINKMNEKDVFPLGTMAVIRRFVDSIGSTGLDQAYLADYFLIGNMFGIPRDVLEAYVSATYENQEKARMAHVSYTMQPKGNDWMNAFERFFGYDKEGKNIYMSWDHLPFMQVFENERANKEQTKVETFGDMLDLQIPLDEINEYLDTSFTIKEPDPVVASPDSSVNIATTSEAQDEGAKAQAQLRASVGGVTGVLSIIAQVASGIVAYSAALSMLMIIYGFPESDARQLLGPEPDPVAQPTAEESAKRLKDMLVRYKEYLVKINRKSKVIQQKSAIERMKFRRLMKQKYGKATRKTAA